MGRRIAVLVSNDLNHDQRVLKTCATLAQEGWTPVLVGREMPNSSDLKVPFEATRLNLPFYRGALFYAALQIGLLNWLLRNSVQAVWANDLDTLLPAFIVARIRKLPLIYDSHEFFTEAAGLTGRPFQRAVWLAVERALFPRVKSVLTVNDGIADAYAERYPKAVGGRPLVLRNMPRKLPISEVPSRDWKTELQIPHDATMLILQGAFLDQDRGVIQAVEALRHQVNWYLVVVGAGAEWDWAHEQVPNFNGRLVCLPKMPFLELRSLTRCADIGLTLDRGIHGNYWMSLPNKLFDYLHAGIPVVASAMPEVARIVETYGVGVVVRDLDAQGIADAVAQVQRLPQSEWRHRCEAAARELHWESEEVHIAVALERASH